MNNVCLIGRLTKDPEIRYASATQMAIARFTIAIDRGKDKDGNDRGADFPAIICFGKTAELVERYLGKGRLVGIYGSLQTGSYEKDGRKVYTTEVLANRIEFLDKGSSASDAQIVKQTESSNSVFDGFTDDDIPF